jgi:hypothetical protein
MPDLVVSCGGTRRSGPLVDELGYTGMIFATVAVTTRGGPGSASLAIQSTSGSSGHYNFRPMLGDGMRHADAMTILRKGSVRMAKVPVKVNGTVTPTRDYAPGFLTPRRTLKAGTSVIILEIHKGLFGDVTGLSVRNPKTGEVFRKVPAEVFGR